MRTEAIAREHCRGHIECEDRQKYHGFDPQPRGQRGERRDFTCLQPAYEEVDHKCARVPRYLLQGRRESQSDEISIASGQRIAEVFQADPGRAGTKVEQIKRHADGGGHGARQGDPPVTEGRQRPPTESEREITLWEDFDRAVALDSDGPASRRKFWA